MVPLKSPSVRLNLISILHRIANAMVCHIYGESLASFSSIVFNSLSASSCGHNHRSLMWKIGSFCATILLLFGVESGFPCLLVGRSCQVKRFRVDLLLCYKKFDGSRWRVVVVNVGLTS